MGQRKGRRRRQATCMAWYSKAMAAHTGFCIYKRPDGTQVRATAVDCSLSWLLRYTGWRDWIPVGKVLRDGCVRSTRMVSVPVGGTVLDLTAYVQGPV